MIDYNSRSVWSLLRWHGSVLPAASRYAAIPSLLAFVLQFLMQTGHIDRNTFDFFGGSQTVFNGFNTVLCFTLVFRAGQSYGRYWESANALHEMMAEWFDACASLITFSVLSKSPPSLCDEFRHTVVRLFSVLNAVAMTEIADLDDENFPIIDIRALDKLSLQHLASPMTRGRRTEVVVQWIKSCILEFHAAGVIHVTPPILTRVFQEIGLGLIRYHDAVQHSIWPFPFPYAQLCMILIAVHASVTPFLSLVMTKNPLVSALATFLSVVCVKSLDNISIEIENPFGEDANDLPCWGMQQDMNSDLLMLLHPLTIRAPRITSNAETDLARLWKTYAVGSERILEFNTASAFEGLKKKVHLDPKIETRKSLTRLQGPEARPSNIRNMLNLRVDDPEEAEEEGNREEHMTFENAGVPVENAAVPVEKPAETPPSLRVAPVRPSVSVESTADFARNSNEKVELADISFESTNLWRRCEGMPDPPWTEFLRELSSELQRHLQRELDQNEDFGARQLELISAAVKGKCSI